MIPQILLKKIGFSEKQTKIYLKLLEVGPCSVRKIALQTGINRGTSYDILKSLMRLGLVSYFHKEKRQYFVAEKPSSLKAIFEKKLKNLESISKDLEETLPVLEAIYEKGGAEPTVKYYEGFSGIRRILKDVLESDYPRGAKEYLVYSAAGIRDYLYKAYPDFTKDRVRKKLKVKVIALGAGGEKAPFSQRRWFSKKEGAPTYTILYGKKIAFISLNALGSPIGVILEDKGIAQTQRRFFDYIWKSLA